MLAVVTVISKAFVTVGAAGARVGCMQETEAEGRTDGVETETIKLINKWSEHDLSTQPLCCMFVKKTRGDDDSSQTITRGPCESLDAPSRTKGKTTPEEQSCFKHTIDNQAASDWLNKKQAAPASRCRSPRPYSARRKDFCVLVARIPRG